MKPRLIIISDLWGVQRSDWLGNYVERLKDKFEIQYYDSCELGGIDTSVYQQNDLHEQFVHGGIELATKRLFNIEKERVVALAFSVGGAIAWKAGLKGLPIDKLYAVSSTRLRYESQKPLAEIKLIFGEKDAYQPSEDWSRKIGVDIKLVKNKNHEFYREEEFAVESRRDRVFAVG